MPENEIPPAMRVDFYLRVLRDKQKRYSFLGCTVLLENREILHFRQNFGLKEVVDSVGLDREEFVVAGDANAFFTGAGAEGAGQFNLIAEVVFGNQVL